jgi:hypothetical protein
MSFELGAQFGWFAFGLFFSFVLICLSAFLSSQFWKFFKRFAHFQIKIESKDYREEIIAERIEQNKKELVNLQKLQRKGKL